MTLDTRRLSSPEDTAPVDGAPIDASALVAQAGAENFPVALRILPRSVRGDLVAIYAFARHIDDLGDRFPGDRLAALEEAQRALDRAWDGAPTDAVYAAVVSTARSTGVGRAPLDDLIEANRLDQRKTRYATYEELAAYCALSANPVGRLVLGAFGVHDERALRYSDAICTGLQLVEHLQDLGEDARAGRVYFPEPDLAEFGVGLPDLLGSATPPSVRRLVAFEAARARTLLAEGAPLVGRLRGARRVALAGFVGGGCAQLDAIERHAYDVLSSLVKAPRWSLLWTVARVATNLEVAVR
jgi:squalene synthase HpnC